MGTMLEWRANGDGGGCHADVTLRDGTIVRFNVARMHVPYQCDDEGYESGWVGDPCDTEAGALDQCVSVGLVEAGARMAERTRAGYPVYPAVGGGLCIVAIEYYATYGPGPASVKDSPFDTLDGAMAALEDVARQELGGLV